MMKIQMKAEEQIADKGGYIIPDELKEAYFISKGISWRDYREMPEHVLGEIEMVWFLNGLVEKKANKI